MIRRVLRTLTQGHGFSLIELLVVMSLLCLLFLVVPGMDNKGIFRMADQDEVQRLVDLLRWAQRRAILTGVQQYLTLNPEVESYKIYTLEGNVERIYKQINLKSLDIVGVNRSIPGMAQTFYFSPQGTPVFGCTVTFKNRWNTWDVVIAVATGKIRIDKR